MHGLKCSSSALTDWMTCFWNAQGRREQGPKRNCLTESLNPSVKGLQKHWRKLIHCGSQQQHEQFHVWLRNDKTLVVSIRLCPFTGKCFTHLLFITWLYSATRRVILLIHTFNWELEAWIHPKFRITPKCRVYTNFFEKFARTFAFFPVTRVRNPTEICSEKLVQMNCFFFLDGFFWVDFLLWNHGRMLHSIHASTLTPITWIVATQDKTWVSKCSNKHITWAIRGSKSGPLGHPLWPQNPLICCASGVPFTGVQVLR